MSALKPSLLFRLLPFALMACSTAAKPEPGRAAPDPVKSETGRVTPDITKPTQLVLPSGAGRAEIAAQMPKHDADTKALKAELASARAEQKRLAKAVALADDVPELVSELKKRSIRIQHLEGQLIAAKRTPDDLAALVTKIEASARARLHDLRTALADQRDLRKVFLALFPEG